MPNTDALAAYDQWHADHPTGQGPWYDLARTVLQDRPDLSAAARVLEIGCGRGDFSAWMAAQGASEVIGEDFSDVVIDTARARHDAPGLAFNVGDIENIAHPDGTFDLVGSFETIEHVPHPGRAVVELARVLKPDGTLLLSTPNYMSITGAHRIFREATGRHWDEGGQPIVHWTMLPRTLRWVKRAGLTVRSINGDGWYLPVRGQPGGKALRPAPALRTTAKYVALHVLIEAKKSG